MQPTTFVFLAFGSNLNHHVMANFSMLSLRKFAPDGSKIVIYTDMPEHYKYVSAFVETRMIDKKRLNDWQGKHKFVWRVKIMALLDSAELDAGHLFYVDGDTFTLRNLLPLVEKLEADHSVMHLKESLLSEDRAKNKMKMWQQMQGKKFGGMLVDSQSAMWNAGIVGMSVGQKKELLEKALLSTDEMCELPVEHWLTEQLSLSQSLASKNKLIPSDEFFAHYWAFKPKFLHHINIFLSNVLQKNLTFDEAAKSIDVETWKTYMVPEAKKTFLQKFLKF